MRDDEPVGDIRIRDVKGTGIAVGHGSCASVGSDPEKAPAKSGARSPALVVAGAVFLVATIASCVLLLVGVIDVAIAGFVLAALAVAVGAAPLLRG